MKVIRFLRPFQASRMVKGTFRLANPQGRSNQGFAYTPCDHEFKQGDQVMVRSIKQGSILVVTENPLLGEMVLDGATEGTDFEIVPDEGTTSGRQA